MSSSENVKEYVLPRDATESARLNSQHELFKSAAGYLLHPRITAALTSSASIADIASGTGVWLFDLASSAQSDWKFTAFDISDAQWPHTADPTRFRFKLVDMRQPLPEGLDSSLDVVHIRVLLSGLTTSDWLKVMHNVFRLLRPGGWIQWQEISPPRFAFIPLTPSASCLNCFRLVEESTKALNRSQKWLAEDMDLFVSRLEAAGFQNCQLHQSPTDRDPQMRGRAATAMLPPLRDALKYAAANDDFVGLTPSEVDMIAKAAESETSEGKVYMRWDMYTFTAQKPTA